MKKKEEQPKPAGLKPEIVSRNLKYNFTTEELSRYNKELAFEVKNLNEIQQEKKLVISILGAKIRTAEGRIQQLANDVNSGYTYKYLDCTITYNFPIDGQKQVTRNDTGEIIETVKMLPSELQEELELKDVPDADNVKQD
jgi:hypothetical protein